MIPKFPLRKVIAVDFDGTLFGNGVINEKVVAFCREKKAAGFEMILWSARGRELCVKAVKEFGLEGIFDHVISKPGYILDDAGWTWIKFTRVIKSPTDV